ncbi:MAG: TonB-dependent receptor, partial [Bacteroides sp. SM23_62_1]
LIPYKLDNVRIKYLGDNKASGYAAGIEFKLHGEFVPGAESWASISFMKTEENILDDYDFRTNKEPGYYPRPMDQRLNFGLFFQDYFPHRPDYKVHLTILYGTGLPFSPPDNERYDLVFRMPSYKRVDIGLSKSLIPPDKVLSERNPFRFFHSIWLNAEIFNLLGVNNTISYLWVKTVFNQESLPGEFAVPNYLTSRRFNVRITAKF